jgi:hypothetical protein
VYARQNWALHAVRAEAGASLCHHHITSLWSTIYVQFLRLIEYMGADSSDRDSSWKLCESRGLFGWAVAVEKVAVGCELWKKLL